MFTIVTTAALIGIVLFALLCRIMYDDDDLKIKLISYSIHPGMLVKDCLGLIVGATVFGLVSFVLIEGATVFGLVSFVLIEYTWYVIASVIALIQLAILYFGYLDGERHDKEIRAYKHALTLIKKGYYRRAANVLYQRALDMDKSEVGGLHHALMDYIRFMIKEYGDKEEPITVYPPVRPNQLLVPASFYQYSTPQMNNDRNK